MRRCDISAPSDELQPETLATTQTLQPKRHTIDEPKPNTMSEPSETVLDAKTVDEGTKEESPSEAATAEGKDTNGAGDAAKTSTDGDAADGEKTSEVKQEGEEEAPTLVQTGEGNGESKLIKELDDEAPKTFPQVVSQSCVCSSFQNVFGRQGDHMFPLYRNVIDSFVLTISFLSKQTISCWTFFPMTRMPTLSPGCHTDVPSSFTRRKSLLPKFFPSTSRLPSSLRLLAS